MWKKKGGGLGLKLNVQPMEEEDKDVIDETPIKLLSGEVSSCLDKMSPVKYKRIGYGNYGVVYKLFWKDTIAVVKFINITNGSKKTYTKQRFQGEVKNLNLLSEKGLGPIIFHSDICIQNEKTIGYIIMENMQYSLQDVITLFRNKKIEENVLNYFKGHGVYLLRRLNDANFFSDDAHPGNIMYNLNSAGHITKIVLIDADPEYLKMFQERNQYKSFEAQKLIFDMKWNQY